MLISISISVGELIDKLTILNIKSERITDEAKLINIKYELELLTDLLNRILDSTPVRAELNKLIDAIKSINEKLWVIEDEIRDHEARKDFGPTFIKLARSVYYTNDERFRLKQQLNLLTNSSIVEEKSYSDYAA